MKIFTVALITGLVILFLVFVCVFLIKKNKKQKQEIKELNEKISRLQFNIKYLVHHLDGMAKIKNEADAISDKLNKAKTDEEISNIVDVIIATNNNRVQDN